MAGDSLALKKNIVSMEIPVNKAKRVADEAQRLIDIYGYYNFLNLVEFMKQRS